MSGRGRGEDCAGTHAGGGRGCDVSCDSVLAGLFEVSTSNAQPIHSYDGHTDNVTAIGFNRTNEWMFSGSEDGTVRLWDLRAPGCQREFESRAAVNSVVLHPGQTELISADQNGNIRVWDIVAGACSCELVPEVGTSVRSLSVAADGSLVVAGNSQGTCYVWRTQRGANHATHFEPLHKLKSHAGYVLKCLISPDVRQLATASSDKTLRLWNLDSFQLDKTLVGHQVRRASASVPSESCHRECECEGAEIRALRSAGCGTAFSPWTLRTWSPLQVMPPQGFGIWHRARPSGCTGELCARWLRLAMTAAGWRLRGARNACPRTAHAAGITRRVSAAP